MNYLTNNVFDLHNVCMVSCFISVSVEFISHEEVLSRPSGILFFSDWNREEKICNSLFGSFSSNWPHGKSIKMNQEDKVTRSDVCLWRFNVHHTAIVIGIYNVVSSCRAQIIFLHTKINYNCVLPNFNMTLNIDHMNI